MSDQFDRELMATVDRDLANLAADNEYGIGLQDRFLVAWTSREAKESYPYIDHLTAYYSSVEEKIVLVYPTYNMSASLRLPMILAEDPDYDPEALTILAGHVHRPPGAVPLIDHRLRDIAGLILFCEGYSTGPGVTRVPGSSFYIDGDLLVECVGKDWPGRSVYTWMR